MTPPPTPSGSIAGLEAIRVGAVAPAARDDSDGRFRRGDSVGFADGEIVAWGGAGSTLVETVAALADDAEIVTVIEGAEAPLALEELGLSLPGRRRARAAPRRDSELLLADRRPVASNQAMSSEKPVLWHIPISHYSEKARWALACKGVEHERRAPLPGAHIPSRCG